ncbi:MAG: trypsin-like peptidase domain-containing protein [Planctomycetota bacterium]|nr:trypsin-like peptidase domain-containing protein [Planctomycetota bacterium]
MANLAMTYVRQARSFMREGDPAKALELLEKARVLVRGDREVERQVLEEMAGVCSVLGRHEQASRCRQRLEVLVPSSVPVTSAVAPTIALTLAKARRWPAVVGVGVVVLILVGCAVAVTAMIMSREGKTASSLPLAANMAGQQPPTTQPAIVAGTVTTSSTQPVAASQAATTVSSMNSQGQFRESIGLVIVMLRYSGTASGQQVQMDIPIATGTAFAIHAKGVMLTNKHVTEAMNNPDVPLTLQDLGMPTLALRDRYLMVCFGAESKDHHPAKLLHQSQKYDMAVLKVNRHFAAPLTLADAPCKQGGTINVCGYPGIVQDTLNKSAATPTRVVEIVQRWGRTGQANWIDFFSSDSFDSTLTRGIVSAPERNIDGVAYLQTDASISQGNSGGPAMNDKNEVVGIVTFGLKGGNTTLFGNYNFALLIQQLHDELDYYLQNN